MRTMCAMLLVGIFGCSPNGGELIPDADSYEQSIDSEFNIQNFLDEHLKNEIVIQLDHELSDLGFTMVSNEALLIFDENGSTGVLLPYNSVGGTEAAVMIISDKSGVHSTALLIDKDGEEISKATMLIDSNGLLVNELIFSNGDVAPPPGGCGGDSWCEFWNCMLIGCGAGSYGCLYTGPAFWECLLVFCGISTYGCWATSF